MRITDLPESNTYENAYTPVDIAGATYKTDVENITPNIANNVSTTSEGYVWAARQGKLLKDRIVENTQGIAETNGTVTQGIVVENDPWTLYQSRTNNTDILYYPRTAKEILITVESTYDNIVMNAVYVPGVYTGTVNLQMGGGYSSLIGEWCQIPINSITRAIGAVAGNRANNSVVTKVYYR